MIDLEEALDDAIDALAPGLIGNPWIPHKPLPAQAVFLGLHLHEKWQHLKPFQALYGGAAGGGKSDALLMALAQTAWLYPGSSGLGLRRTYAELMMPDALMDRAMQWWHKGLGIHWNGTEKIFTFPNGSRVKFGYHSHPTHNAQYQGAAFQTVCPDELTHWPDSRAYDWIGKSRVRRPAGSGIPLRVLSGSNPGGPGHAWVKRKFIGGTDPKTGAALAPEAPYVPARIVDNPYLDRSEYESALAGMHPTIRAQLLRGDWDARQPGDYFRTEWWGPILPEGTDIPIGERIDVRWWDLAASEADDAARTAGVRMARLRSGVRVVINGYAFRLTPGKRDSRIVQQAHLDGRHVVVGLEVEPGSGGIAQFEALKKRLNAEGFRVVGKRPSAPQISDREKVFMMTNPVSVKGKLGRCVPVAACLERGYQMRGEGDDEGAPWWGKDIGRSLLQQRDGLRIMAWPGVQEYLDEVGVAGTDDEVLMDYADATSGAWAYLESHPFGLRKGLPIDKKEQPPSELANVHPEDRPDPRDADRSPSGHWRP